MSLVEWVVPCCPLVRGTAMLDGEPHRCHSHAPSRPTSLDAVSTTAGDQTTETTGPEPVGSETVGPGPVGWGVLGPGRISHAFAADLALLDDAALVATGSRSYERAAAFADEHGGTPYGSYAELVADPGVDVVYVASPHSEHPAHVRLALEAGKHVLCEKPVALRGEDAREMVRLAREHGLFFMEAMWTACHPVVRALLERLATGELGTPRQLRAELGFRVGDDPTDRLLAPDLGGGALLDMGIYPLTLAHLVLGAPDSLAGVAVLTEDGIDLDVALAARYPGGAVAAMSASLSSWSDRSAAIATDLGRIELIGQFHHPERAVFTPYGGAGGTGEEAGTGQVVIEAAGPLIGRGYGNEAAEVGRCLRAGLTESPLIPHAQTLAVMDSLDELRRQLAIRYPDDPPGWAGSHPLQSGTAVS